VAWKTYWTDADCNWNIVSDIETSPDYNSAKRNSYKNIGICSFSEVLDDPVMWAHYTNSYNGYVLKFKGDNIEAFWDQNLFEKYTLTRVIYPDQPKQIKTSFPFAQHYVLSTKFKRWSYEKEWRAIIQLASNGRKLTIDKSSIEAIYIGHEIVDKNDSGYSILNSIIDSYYPELPVYIVYPHPTKLELMFEKVWDKSD